MLGKHVALSPTTNCNGGSIDIRNRIERGKVKGLIAKSSLDIALDVEKAAGGRWGR